MQLRQYNWCPKTVFVEIRYTIFRVQIEDRCKHLILLLIFWLILFHLDTLTKWMEITLGKECSSCIAVEVNEFSGLLSSRGCKNVGSPPHAPHIYIRSAHTYRSLLVVIILLKISALWYFLLMPGSGPYFCPNRMTRNPWCPEEHIGAETYFIFLGTPIQSDCSLRPTIC